MQIEIDTKTFELLPRAFVPQRLRDAHQFQFASIAATEGACVCV